MKRIVISLAAGLVLGLGAATFAAQNQQQGADRPGIVMQPTVKVDNRGASEAIPVAIQDWGAVTRPLPVQVNGPVEVIPRPVVQRWEYTAISMEPNQELASTLAAAGLAGWEAVGFATNTTRATVLLKRPRP